MKLPFRNFQWISESECCDIIADINATCSQNGQYGYVFEVDFEIPCSIMDNLNDMPLAPEKQRIKREWLTEYMEESWNVLNNKLSYRGAEKLLLTHFPKKNYVVHGELLKFYLSCGVIITKIHKGISFEQDFIFKDYISFNSEKRAKSTNNLQKDYYKLKNNALYGKSVENVRKRRDIRIVNTEKKYITYASNPNFKYATRIADNLVIVEMLKTEIILDKPIFIGFTVLELSKLMMYKLRYHDLVRYEKELNGKIEVVAMDTDSFFLHLRGITTEHILEKFDENGILDSSNFKREHYLYSEKCKAKLGCLKDECCGEYISRAIFLRPKNYCLKICGEEKKIAKGVQKCVLQNEISFADYDSVIKHECNEIIKDNRRFHSKNHEVTTINQSKRVLCCFDDKRAWLDSNTSLPYGHPATKRRRMN